MLVPKTITQNGTYNLADDLVHEYIPWQENGVAYLKDIVTSEIKYNAGTGDFVYGTDVA